MRHEKTAQHSHVEKGGGGNIVIAVKKIFSMILSD